MITIGRTLMLFLWGGALTKREGEGEREEGDREREYGGSVCFIFRVECWVGKFAREVADMLSVPMWQPTVVHKESWCLGEVGGYLDGAK